MKNILFSFLFIILIMGCDNDEMWEKASKNNSITSYSDYIKANPEGPYADSCRIRITNMIVSTIFGMLYECENSDTLITISKLNNKDIKAIRGHINTSAGTLDVHGNAKPIAGKTSTSIFLEDNIEITSFFSNKNIYSVVSYSIPEGTVVEFSNGQTFRFEGNYFVEKNN